MGNKDENPKLGRNTCVYLTSITRMLDTLTLAAIIVNLDKDNKSLTGE
ncbi:MAG: hypothetical protein K8H85_03935 [Cyclobacteriaceae bacterium]|nr:hypothetical protein [Cyclobacteriaceae bacterium]